MSGIGDVERLLRETTFLHEQVCRGAQLN
jgi:hypothetical protein